MNFHTQVIAGGCAVLIAASALATESRLSLHDKEYFSARGLDVLVFSNTYDGLFSDAKIAGV